MSLPHTPKQNHLLAALPADDYARLAPDLHLTPMPLGWAVYESGGIGVSSRSGARRA